MRRTGLLMIIAGWLILAGLVWWVLDGALERRDNPNAALATVTGGQRENLLKLGRDGHYRAPGRINGHPVEFLIDTGATQVALSQDLSRKLGLRLGRAHQAETAGGVVLAYPARLDSVSLGGLEARGVTASVIAASNADEVLLGMSFLSRFDIRLNNGEMSLRAR